MWHLPPNYKNWSTGPEKTIGNYNSRNDNIDSEEQGQEANLTIGLRFISTAYFLGFNFATCDKLTTSPTALHIPWQQVISDWATVGSSSKIRLALTPQMIFSCTAKFLLTWPMSRISWHKIGSLHAAQACSMSPVIWEARSAICLANAMSCCLVPE